jgi:ferredoxin-NADP reductase
LRFQPGQFLTFVVNLDGKEIRRGYSFSSSPLNGGAASVTIKRIPDGLVSNHMNRNVKAGDLLQVLGPSGEFVAGPSTGAPRHFVFVAGGSGITPLMSLTETLLVAEPDCKIDLLYGNRSLEDVIFRQRLQDLALRHPNLTVHHVLQNPPAGWNGATGLLTGEKILALAGGLDHKNFFICGPEAMMHGAAAALKAAGVPDTRIKTERFTSPAKRTGRQATGSFPITFVRSGATVQPKPGETILDAGLGAGLDLSYSCAMGGCASCRVRVTRGTVEMEEPNCLSPEEREQGYVLACVACPTSNVEVDA